jgi:hypothetical protein
MIAYFDCFSGIAGDMIIGAMIDLGLEPDLLRDRLKGLNLEDYALEATRETRRGLSGVYFQVKVSSGHSHRTWAQIRDMIGASDLGPSVISRSIEIFSTLARAEAKVHGVEVENVHFHEVGAVDSIIDIVGVCVGLEELAIEEARSSPLPVNRGFTGSSHGALPLPAPATMELLTGIPIHGHDSSLELVTPTGAAIVKTLAREFGSYPDFTPAKVGYGLGKADPEEFPNALRISLGEADPKQIFSDEVVKLETNVDDMDPRVLGHLMERLLKIPALDVAYGPVQMKKNRPGVMIMVLVRPQDAHRASELIMEHTSSLGVRCQKMGRITLEREIITQRTSLGEIRVKCVRTPEQRIEKRPEYDDMARKSFETGIPLRELLMRLDRELNRD